MGSWLPTPVTVLPTAPRNMSQVGQGRGAQHPSGNLPAGSREGHRGDGACVWRAGGEVGMKV